MRDTCGNCTYYEPLDETCHVHPPAAVPGQTLHLARELAVGEGTSAATTGTIDVSEYVGVWPRIPPSSRACAKYHEVSAQAPVAEPADVKLLRDKLRSLDVEWRLSTAFLPDPRSGGASWRKIKLDKTVDRIVELGADILPLVRERLELKPDLRWCLILQKVIQDGPEVPDDKAEDAAFVTKAWLDWLNQIDAQQVVE